MLTLPNLLTLSRIFAVPILVLLLWHPSRLDYALCFGLYVLMAVTDYFDGYVARAQGAVSKLGIFLDPIADKIMVAAVIVMLIVTGDIVGSAVIAALIILIREIAVSGLREFLADLRVSMPVSQLAKWKTAVQMLAIAFLLVGDAASPWITQAGLWLIWIAAGLTLITGYDYLRTGLRHMAEDAPPGAAE